MLDLWRLANPTLAYGRFFFFTSRVFVFGQLSILLAFAAHLDRAVIDIMPLAKRVGTFPPNILTQTLQTTKLSLSVKR